MLGVGAEVLYSTQYTCFQQGRSKGGVMMKYEMVSNTSNGQARHGDDDTAGINNPTLTFLLKM